MLNERPVVAAKEQSTSGLDYPSREQYKSDFGIFFQNYKCKLISPVENNGLLMNHNMKGLEYTYGPTGDWIAARDKPERSEISPFWPILMKQLQLPYPLEERIKFDNEPVISVRYHPFSSVPIQAGTTKTEYTKIPWIAE